MTITRVAALRVVRSIVRDLTRDAIEHDGRCTWMGTTQDLAPDGVSLAFRYATLGPDLYGGTAGVATFLAHAARALGDGAAGLLACGAARHALARAASLRAAGRLGFYDGATGIAYAAAQVARLTGTPALRDEARAVLAGLRASECDAMGLDVIDGAAGAAPALIMLARRLDAPELLSVARHLGDRIVADAHRGKDGWSWAFLAQGGDQRDLTGFSHGAAGMAWSLRELHAATGVPEFLVAADEAIRFETHWFRPQDDNWPDFRDHAGDPADAACAHAWCHGAPGIGLARLRAFARTGGAEMRRDAEAAVRASTQWLTRADQDSDFTLCHGRSGAAELLLEAGRVLGDTGAERLARRIAKAGASRFAGAERGTWPCGVRRGSSPSLMIGTAGVGYFFLRLADATVPSMLIPASDID